MFTHVYLSLLVFTYVYHCLLYLCLSMFTSVHLCLLVFIYVFHCLLVWPTGRNEILIDVQTCQYSPDEILHKCLVLILACTVISIEVDCICSYARILEVVMDVADICVCSFSCVYALVD